MGAGLGLPLPGPFGRRQLQDRRIDFTVRERQINEDRVAHADAIAVDQRLAGIVETVDVEPEAGDEIMDLNVVAEPGDAAVPPGDGRIVEGQIAGFAAADGEFVVVHVVCNKEDGTLERA